MRHACYLAILFGLADSAASKESEPYWETPNQKFYALGGKETPAKIISRGQELTADDIAQGRDLCSCTIAADCSIVSITGISHLPITVMYKRFASLLGALAPEEARLYSRHF